MAMTLQVLFEQFETRIEERDQDRQALLQFLTGRFIEIILPEIDNAKALLFSMR